MLRFNLLGIPVVVEPFFWLIIFVIGSGLKVTRIEHLIPVAIWMVVAFISILVHELGHALMGRKFGVSPGIKLHGFGGSTYFPSGYFSRKESIAVTAAGPMAGFALGALFLIINQTLPIAESPRILLIAVTFFIFINIFWTIINLLPIQPMDGGQILRDVLGPTRHEITRWVGVICAGVVAYWAWRFGQIFLAIFMVYLGWLNFQEQRISGGVILDR